MREHTHTHSRIDRMTCLYGLHNAAQFVNQDSAGANKELVYDSRRHKTAMQVSEKSQSVLNIHQRCQATGTGGNLISGGRC